MKLWINCKLVGMVSPPDNTSSFSIRGIFGFSLRKIFGERLSSNTYPKFTNHNNNIMEHYRAE